ncbi:MAG TPA: heavy metal-binding domain-containing protein, partial [Allosphingosinicella sp.]
MQDRGCCEGHGKADHAAPARGTVLDPVCGMTVDPAVTPHHARHAGEDYHFCSAKCRDRFAARPEFFLDDAPKPPSNGGGKDEVYTCPMHPEVEQIGPGTCPICGMALEPVVATQETGASPELRDMTRRFWIGLALAAPVFVPVEQLAGTGGEACASAADGHFLACVEGRYR